MRSGPRFGVMRAREFIMKDAYSFHLDEQSLLEGYQTMRAAYERVFDRLGLEYRIVQADTGAIGGSRSEEFQVLAASGEDAIAWCDADGFAANLEVVGIPAPETGPPPPSEECELVETRGVGTIAALADFLGVGANRCLKTLLVKGTDAPAVALLLRGDHQLNALKAQKLDGVATPLTMLRGPEVERATGCAPGYLGPVEAGRADVRRSIRDCDRGLRLRRKQAGLSLQGRELGARTSTCRRLRICAMPWPGTRARPAAGRCRLPEA